MSSDVAPSVDPNVITFVKAGASTDPNDAKLSLARLTVPQKNRALFEIMGQGYVFLIGLLVDAGADPNCADVHGGTPLHGAADEGDTDSMRALIRLGAKPVADLEGFTPLHLCAGHDIMAQILLTRFPELANQKSESGLFPIFRATNDTFHLFVAAGADLRVLNGVGQSLFRFAPPGWMGTLILAGVDPKAKENKNILLEAYRMYLMDIAALLHAGADPNVVDDKTGNTPLHNMIYKNRDPPMAPKVQLLLRSGASPLARDRRGNTPLHLAITRHDAVIDALVYSEDAQRDLYSFLNARNEAGDTPLHLALEVEAVERLVRLGADINFQDTNGNTPLHLAVVRFDTATVEFLLKNGAATDIQNGGGTTPLELATVAKAPGHYPNTKVSSDVREEMLWLLRQTVTPSVGGKAAASRDPKKKK